VQSAGGLRAAAILCLGLLAVTGCESDGDGGATTPDGPPAPADGPPAPPADGPPAPPADGPPAPPADAGLAADATGACLIEQLAPPSEGGAHVPECQAVSYASKPPSSGTHYPTWPVFRVYDKPVPWGFLVHGMEHGVVVIAHNCLNCDSDIAAIKQLWADTPRKSACPRPPVIVTPDPTLDVPFAAAAWGHILRARCFDRAVFAAFIAANANHGPELFADDCGYADKEAAGWCP
jgi:Protein of unknown function (DUF3105)